MEGLDKSTLKARKILLWMLAYILIHDIIAIFLIPRPASIIKLEYTIVLFWFILQGYKWAKWTAIVTFFLGSVFSIGFGIYLFSDMHLMGRIFRELFGMHSISKTKQMIGASVTIIEGVSLLLIPLYLLLSKNLRKYLDSVDRQAIKEKSLKGFSVVLLITILLTLAIYLFQYIGILFYQLTRKPTFGEATSAFLFVSLVTLYTSTYFMMSIWNGILAHNTGKLSSDNSCFSMAKSILFYYIPLVNFVVPWIGLVRIWKINHEAVKKKSSAFFIYFTGCLFFITVAILPILEVLISDSKNKHLTGNLFMCLILANIFCSLLLSVLLFILVFKLFDIQLTLIKKVNQAQILTNACPHCNLSLPMGVDFCPECDCTFQSALG